MTASIGIAIANQDFSPAELLRNADTAMYQAKARGKARYEVFEARMHAETLARLELENELRRALERNELSLLYQPIVSLRDGTITGMEALVRWEHPRRGTCCRPSSSPPKTPADRADRRVGAERGLPAGRGVAGPRLEAPLTMT